MSSYSNEKENHVVETLTPQIDDNNDTLLAMVLGANLVFPAVLNAAIELNLFEIIAKETSLDNLLNILKGERLFPIASVKP
jgi:caffeic acid 3-O-methyltransferase